MVRQKGLGAGFLGLVLATGLAGCATVRPIDRTSGAKAPGALTKIEIGDFVSVKMSDGSTHRFEVRGIDRDTLVSDSGRRYARSDIASLKRESGTARKAAKHVAGGYAVLMRILTFGN